MDFAKYYDATKLVDDMQRNEEIDSYPTRENDKFVGVYVCMDTNLNDEYFGYNFTNIFDSILYDEKQRKITT